MLGLGGVTGRNPHTDMGLGAAQQGHIKDEKQKMEFLFQEHLWTCVLCEPGQLVRAHGPYPAGEPDSEPAPRRFWKTWPAGEGRSRNTETCLQAGLLPLRLPFLMSVNLHFLCKTGSNGLPRKLRELNGIYSRHATGTVFKL